MRVLLPTSGGGHLSHLWALQNWWSSHTCHWVALDTPDARVRLADETVTWVRGPTNRSASALLRGSVRAPGLMRRFRPDLVVSAGAAVAVPFFACASAMRIPSVFIEVIDRVDRPTLTGRLVRPFATRVVVHWPEQRDFYPRAEVLGPLWGGP